MELLKSVINVKNIIILLTLVALVAGVVGYFNLNGKNVAWCSVNINDCRVARIQALDRDVNVLEVSK